MTGKNKENYNKNYNKYVHLQSPKTKQLKTLFNAFIVGGFICCIGQFIRYMFQYWAGLEGDVLAGSTSIVMIFLGAFLTGLGVYDKIGKHAGGGSIVPITGFANSVASPAIEFKSEGFINGVAAKMFIIAGPIIVYGIIAGVAVGIIYLLI
jgi:stage V sporulation protein AC